MLGAAVEAETVHRSITLSIEADLQPDHLDRALAFAAAVPEPGRGRLYVNQKRCEATSEDVLVCLRHSGRRLPVTPPQPHPDRHQDS